MSFSIQLWDDQKVIQLLSKQQPQALIISNDILSMIIRDKLRVAYGFSFLPAEEISPDWIEQRLLSLSLFAQEENFYIYASEKLSKGSISIFLQNWDILQDRFLLFSFSSKLSFQNTFKEVECSSIHLTEPRFWEYPKLLDYFCDYFSLKLSFKAKEYFQENILQEIDEYFYKLMFIKNNLKEQSRQLELKDIEGLLKHEKFDKFYMARLLAQKEYTKLLELLTSDQLSWQQLRDIVVFLKSHLLKIFDPSYTEDKGRITKYDQQIIQAATNWHSKDIAVWHDFFVNLEIMTKKRDPFVANYLNRFLLSLY